MTTQETIALVSSHCGDQCERKYHPQHLPVPQ